MLFQATLRLRNVCSHVVDKRMLGRPWARGADDLSRHFDDDGLGVLGFLRNVLPALLQHF